MDMTYSSNDAVCSIQGFPNGRHVLELIHKICEKGSDAEVRRNSDGTYKVYEVKKKYIK